MTITNLPAIRARHAAWNKGRLVGQKRPLLPKHVWAIRVRLELAERHRDLALFNMAIDSKLRGCDLIRLSVTDIYAAGQVKERAAITQRKTSQPVRFEITVGTRIADSLDRDPADVWIRAPVAGAPARQSPHFHQAICPAGSGMGDVRRVGAKRLWYALDASYQGRANLPKNGELACGAILARPHKDGRTVRYLGVDLEDALTISEGVEI